MSTASGSCSAGGAATEPQPTVLLDWLVERCGATPACPKVERRYVSDEVGWCLVATADIEPEEVILSVPLTAAITSEGVDESRWSTHMAAALLGREAADTAAGDAATGARSSRPWLAALPRHVDLCWLYWSDAELAQLQDEDTVAEAQQLRSMYEAACQASRRAAPACDGVLGEMQGQRQGRLRVSRSWGRGPSS
jgi:hypothetical protein